MSVLKPYGIFNLLNNMSLLMLFQIFYRNPRRPVLELDIVAAPLFWPMSTFAFSMESFRIWFFISPRSEDSVGHGW